MRDLIRVLLYPHLLSAVRRAGPVDSGAHLDVNGLLCFGHHPTLLSPCGTSWTLGRLLRLLFYSFSQFRSMATLNDRPFSKDYR
jgi:hypothetical protein